MGKTKLIRVKVELLDALDRQAKEIHPEITGVELLHYWLFHVVYGDKLGPEPEQGE